MLKTIELQKAQNFIDLLESKGIIVNKFNLTDALYKFKSYYTYNLMHDVIDNEEEYDYEYTEYGIGYALKKKKLYRIVYCILKTDYDRFVDYILIDFDEPEKIIINDEICENKGFTNMVSMLIDHAGKIRKKFNCILSDYYGVAIDDPDFELIYDSTYVDSIKIRLYKLAIFYEFLVKRQKIQLEVKSKLKSDLAFII